jgi:hypothetical protein
VVGYLIGGYLKSRIGVYGTRDRLHSTSRDVGVGNIEKMGICIRMVDAAKVATCNDDAFVESGHFHPSQTRQRVHVPYCRMRLLDTIT